MGRLIKVVLSFVLLSSASCLQKRGIVETNYGYNPYQQSPAKLVQAPNYFDKEQASPIVPDGSKQSPIIVSVPNYHHQQQFQTVGQPEYHQAAAQIPYTAQQNVYHQGALPYSQQNQYSVHQPYQPAGQSNLYVPFNQFQQFSANVNSDFRKPVLQNKPLPQPTNTSPQIHHQIGQKVGTVKSVPVFHHQVYHPLHTSVVNPVQKQQLAPPTPPRIYTNFHPIIPPKPAPVQQSPVRVAQEKPVTEEQEDDKEEINEEEDEENEKQEEEEEEHSDIQEENGEERENYGPGKFFSGRFMTDDEEDHGRYRHEHREADEDEDDDRYSESRPSKLSSKYKYPKDSYYKDKHFSKPFKTDPDFKNFKEPKVEYKMYKYSKTSNKPERKEYIEGKGSENIPVVQHNQKSYKEQWIISSKTSSMTNEE